MKRSIQTHNPGYFVGVEFDSRSIRAARVSSDGRGGFAVSALEESTGDFTEEQSLIEGLRQIKARLGVGVRDAIVSCLAGKQVFATQMEFRRLSGDEMEQALRLELRKIVHFEVATSALDYEILGEDEDSSGGQCQVMLALASNSLLSRHMQSLEKAGFRPAVVDVLPLAIANALWAWRGDDQPGPTVALHLGSQVSTIVIDGEYSPCFNRSIPFAADEAQSEEAGPAERAKRYAFLAEEVARSIAFYEKNPDVSGISELALLGDRLDDPGLSEAIRRRTGMSPVRMDLASRIGGKGGAPGKFDVAIALAMRGDR